MTKSDKIQELLTRGVDEVIDRKHLEQALRSGKKLRVKLGIDPTSPNIHIGRAVVLWKLRAFQELGHKVVFVIGDSTAEVGDTSDKDSERPVLKEAEIKKNMKGYFDQALLILDKAKTEVRYNSEWLKKIGSWEIIKLADLFSLNEFQSRELIKQRVQAGKSVSMRETIYPLMQGYDSVALKADVELGGTDQRYNLLAGRVIQKAYGQPPQDILTTKLLEGTDGRKMSSSWGNVINLIDAPNEMFGKVMSISDELIEKYFVLALDPVKWPLPAIKKVLQDQKNPRDQKIVLAEALVEQYHPKQGVTARDNFIAQFVNKQAPENVAQKEIKPGTYALSELVVMTGLAASKSEARRLIEQKGVKLNHAVVEKDLPVEVAAQTIFLQVGKRRFLRIK